MAKDKGKTLTVGELITLLMRHGNLESKVAVAEGEQNALRGRSLKIIEAVSSGSEPRDTIILQVRP